MLCEIILTIIAIPLAILAGGLFLVFRDLRGKP